METTDELKEKTLEEAKSKDVKFIKIQFTGISGPELAMLRAGMDGIKNKLSLPEPINEDVYEFDTAKLAELKIDTLPGSLGEAIEELRKSSLMEETLGKHIFSKYIELKEKEWDEYRIRVTEWEIDKYLEML